MEAGATATLKDVHESALDLLVSTQERCCPRSLPPAASRATPPPLTHCTAARGR